MTDLTEYPLVTFALFAYNQEKYIREAVESAFSQTYEPLEIILSDDCSGDRTFEIMQEMAAAYHGPHRVIVRQGSLNAGTARHVQEVFAVSAGKLFVVAAGDDISYPRRVSALFATWDRAGRPSGVVHSGWETFRDGESTSLRQYPPKRSNVADNILESYARAQWLPAAAPTVAYTRDVFETFPPLFGGSIIEDAPLFLRAALIGCFLACDDVLVRLRLHDENSGTGYTISSPARWNRFMQSKLIAFRNMQSDLRYGGEDVDSLLRTRIEGHILAVLHSVSGLFLPEGSLVGRKTRLALFFKMVFAPAVARTFRLRLEYALSFVGFSFHLSLKNSLRRLLGIL